MPVVFMPFVFVFLISHSLCFYASYFGISFVRSLSTGAPSTTLVQIENLVEYIWAPPHTHTRTRLSRSLSPFTKRLYYTRAKKAKDRALSLSARFFGDKKQSVPSRRGSVTFSQAPLALSLSPNRANEPAMTPNITKPRYKVTPHQNTMIWHNAQSKTVFWSSTVKLVAICLS